MFKPNYFKGVNMAKQLEINFNEKSDTLKKLEKEIPDFKKHGFQTKEEWHKAKLFDKEWKRITGES